MKRIIFVIILMVLFVRSGYAELYVLIDKNTREVLSASEKNDTLEGEGQEIKVITGSLEDFSGDNPVFYKLSGKKFIKNISKIDEEERAKIAREEKAQEESVIQEKMKSIAVEQLKTEGKKFKYH